MSKAFSPTLASYSVPRQMVSFETEIKRSRFIAEISRAEDKASAELFIRGAKQKYPDARHHCWAYIASPPQSASLVKFSDDGEPQGTAGKPILNILQHSGLGEIICVVSRYFGGVKLGAGGLVRAYSDSTKAALEILPRIEKIPICQLQLLYDYGTQAQVRYLLDKFNAKVIATQYQQQIDMLINLAEHDKAVLIEQLNVLQYQTGKQVQINALSIDCD